MNRDHPIWRALLLVALGFAIGAVSILAYQWLNPSNALLDDQALDELARQKNR